MEPLKRRTGSNLVDVGRATAHDRLGGRLRTRFYAGRDGGHEESLRRTPGEAVGQELGAAPVDRLLGHSVVFTKTSRLLADLAGGHADRS